MENDSASLHLLANQTISTYKSYQKQSHYREVTQWEIFMELELRFGLDFGQLAALKKKGLGGL